MGGFESAPPGDIAKGAKIFKTKCAQCHVAQKVRRGEAGLLSGQLPPLFCRECHIFELLLVFFFYNVEEARMARGKGLL